MDKVLDILDAMMASVPERVSEAIQRNDRDMARRGLVTSSIVVQGAWKTLRRSLEEQTVRIVDRITQLEPGRVELRSVASRLKSRMSDQVDDTLANLRRGWVQSPGIDDWLTEDEVSRWKAENAAYIDTWIEGRLRRDRGKWVNHFVSAAFGAAAGAIASLIVRNL